ncbi:MAG: peptidoglycan DD-metalloendopeptidase family protein [Lachnospiraceae bacterium]|nr:peptidoglycan DD-metalloendopeptidase family protein [Lachnospiraceae bacterium]
MKKITKRSKKIRITYIAAAISSCFIMLLASPWVYTAKANQSEGYFVAELNGEKVGAARTEEEINEAFKEARRKMNSESETLTFADTELKIYKQNKVTGIIDSNDKLVESMYAVLSDATIDVKSEAYMVNIDGFTVTLASKEDVVALFDAATAKYNKNNKFTVDIVSLGDSDSTLTSQMVSADIEAADKNTVASSEDEKGNSTDKKNDKEEEKEIKLGMSGITFEENVEITQCYVDSSKVISVEEAIEQVTKEKEKNQIYVVESGDCLSVIADKFDLRLAELLAMNEGLKEDSFIGVGDELIVTVPEPELSVLVSKIKNFDEDFNLPVEYVYNDNEYTNYENVLNEGKTGYRNVTAEITYKNGVEINREILEEKVITEAVAKVVEVGTLTPPTYVKPIYGGYLSSDYGARWGTVHKGIDWACPIGTSVFASCGGTVVSAGWRNGYGYCVEIAHPDGKHTRYAHLNEVLVYPGQTVAQYEQIARSGNTGNSTGPHVHFEILVWGVQQNPNNYLQ